MTAAASQDRPLEGVRIVVTRDRARAGRLAQILELRGAEIIEFPTIEIVSSGAPLSFAADDTFNWVAFTSGNAVRYLHEAFEREGRRFVFPGARICAVGPATESVLHAHRIDTDLLPTDYRAEALPPALVECEGDLTGKRILLPRGDLADDTLPDALRSHGAEVVEYVAYRTVCPEVSPEAISALIAAHPHIVTFTSASTAKNFAVIAGKEFPSGANRGVVAANIGPETAAAQRETLAFPASIDATEHTLDGLAAAIIDYVQSPRFERSDSNATSKGNS